MIRVYWVKDSSDAHVACYSLEDKGMKDVICERRRSCGDLNEGLLVVRAEDDC